MKGNIDYLISGVKMHLTYRYFSENDEFELVRGEFFDRSEIFPSALKLLETAPMHAEKIRDLIYLDLCAWGAGIALPSTLYVFPDEAAAVAFSERFEPFIPTDLRHKGLKMQLLDS